MVERETWSPPAYAWVLLGLVALALTPKVAPSRLQGHWLLITPCLIVVGVLLIRKLWTLHPAVTLCATVVVTIFSGAWSKMGLGGLPFDRLLAIIVLLAMFLRAPGVARVPRIQIKGVHLLLAVTAIYALASACAAGTLTSKSGSLSLIDELGIAPYLLFLVTPAIFAGRHERDMLLATLVGLGAYLGFTAIFEALGPHFLVFPRYIVHVDAESPTGRAYGPFQGSTAEGFATFACAVAAVIAFFQWRRPYPRWSAAVVAVACIFGCFLTLERGVWIAAASAIAITALVTRRGRRWLLPGILACVFVIAAVSVFSPALVNKTSSRVNDQLSIWDRQNQTTAGLRMLAAKPLLGFGWDRYTRDSLPYFRQAADYPLDGYELGQLDEYRLGDEEVPLPLHNTYLSYAVELGIIGALLWLTSLLWGVGGAVVSHGTADLRSWKLGLLALIVFALVVGVVNPYQAPFPTLLLWVWAGVAIGNGRSLRPRQKLISPEESSNAVISKSDKALWLPA